MKYHWDYNSDDRTLSLGQSKKQVALLRMSNRYRCICEAQNSSYFFKSDGLLSKKLKLKSGNGDIIADICFDQNFKNAEIWYQDTRYNFKTDGRMIAKEWTLQNGKGPMIKAKRSTKNVGELESEHSDELLPTIGLYAYMHLYESKMATLSIIFVTSLIAGLGTTLALMLV